MPRVVRILRALHAGYNAARAEQPPPTPHFGTGPSARAARVAIIGGVAALALVALDAPGSLPHSWVPYFRLAAAAVMLPVGAWLTWRARRPRAARGVRARTIEWLLEMTGIVMLAVGVLELVLGLVRVH